MDLAARLYDVKERIAQAAQVSGRSLSDITLIAVSKTHPLDAVLAVARHGQYDFGESYMQEALGKLAEFDANGSLDCEQKNAICWHFIGHLQSNKAKDAAGRFGLIHTVHSSKLAQGLHNRLECLAQADIDDSGVRHLTQDILIQVNIGQESQKFGVLEKDVPGLVEQVLSLNRLNLRGLMCIPPLSSNPEEARSYFIRLRQLSEHLESNFGKGIFRHLSMGMSQDFEVAIEEGATFVRVGTDIFGAREY